MREVGSMIEKIYFAIDFYLSGGLRFRRISLTMP